MPELTVRAFQFFDPTKATGFKDEKSSAQGGSGQMTSAFFDSLVKAAGDKNDEAIELLTNLAAGASGAPDGKAFSQPSWARQAADALRALHDTTQNEAVRDCIKACAWKLAEIEKACTDSAPDRAKAAAAAAASKTASVGGKSAAVDSVQPCVPGPLLALALDHGLEVGAHPHDLDLILTQIHTRSRESVLDSSRQSQAAEDPHRFVSCEEVFSLLPEEKAGAAVVIHRGPPLLLNDTNRQPQIPVLQDRAQAIKQPTAFLLYSPGHWMSLYLVPNSQGKIDAVLFDSYGTNQIERGGAVELAVREAVGHSKMGEFLRAGGDMQGQAINACGPFCVRAMQATAQLQGNPTAESIKGALDQSKNEFEAIGREEQAATIASLRSAMAANAERSQRAVNIPGADRNDPPSS